MRLVTLEEYRKFGPRTQGYVIYMQAMWPGSELRDHQECPYPAGSPERVEWDRGQMDGVLEAQDSEG